MLFMPVCLITVAAEFIQLPKYLNVSGLFGVLLPSMEMLGGGRGRVGSELS